MGVVAGLVTGLLAATGIVAGGGMAVIGACLVVGVAAGLEMGVALCGYMGLVVRLAWEWVGLAWGRVGLACETCNYMPP